MGFLRITVPSYSPSEFYSHFRMKKNTVEKIINEVGRNKCTAQRGRTPISIKDTVLMSLWILATTESYRQISDRFDIAISTCHDIFDDFCQTISACVKKFIKWPSMVEMAIIAKAFEQKTGFPGVIGAIDGCHIPIKKPTTDGDGYFNRKKFPSIILMAVTDHNLIFRDICVGWPGSVHDSRVHRNSHLHTLLSESKLPASYHIIGDSAFSNSTSLLVPFKDNGHLTEKQKNFNKVLSSTRVVVEHAFGLLKGKFRQIKTLLDVTETSRATTITVAACVLHNIYISESDWLDTEIDISSDDGEEEESTCIPASGDAKRMYIANILP